MKPVEILMVDEAAQLKECESLVPLQLPGLCHAILIGDERQLPAMVKSKISEKAVFGRSLFERLVQLGCYWFINIANGKEEFDRGSSQKNMAEVAVVYEIVASLYREFTCTKKKVSVGVISPYKAQVDAIQARVRKYSANSGTSDFALSVRSVDGFQGGDEDVIIISIVRCNENGSEESNKLNNYGVAAGRGLINVVFSWSPKDVLNAKLYENQGGSSCTICFSKDKCFDSLSTKWPEMLCDLNQSQKAAVLNSISLSKCKHQNSINLIWGPPGTGKTKTVGISLFALYKFKCRTLTCAPTNIAVLEVTDRLVRLVNQSLEYDKYGLGDIILFGNGERMKIGSYNYLFEVFLDRRISILTKCFSPLSGWNHWLELMISLLENPEEQYLLYIIEKQKHDEQHKESENSNSSSDDENKFLTFEKSVKEKHIKDDKQDEESENSSSSSDDKNVILAFEEFVNNRLDFIGQHLTVCMVNLYTHLPTACISLEVVKDMIRVAGLLKSISIFSWAGVTNKQLKLLQEDCTRTLKLTDRTAETSTPTYRNNFRRGGRSSRVISGICWVALFTPPALKLKCRVKFVDIEILMI
ncbi:unnamed protein product [Malus baccata var. baccata]